MRFERPGTTSEAVAMLQEAGAASYVLAGGTDLLVRMQRDDFDASLIVDIKSIDGMKDIAETADGGFLIGAGVPCAALAEHAGLVANWPGVVEAANLIGSTQIQGRCTMSGNLCNASPAADSVPALVAAGARARIAGPAGTRALPVEDVPVAPGKTALSPGEFIEAIELDAPGQRSGDAYLRFIPRTEMDIAVVGVGVRLILKSDGTVQQAKIALGAVGPKVVVAEKAAAALVGTKLEDAALEALAQACSDSANPIDDKRGTVDFRKDVVGVLAKRAARIAYTRAGDLS